MHLFTSLTLLLAAALTPTRTWYPPDVPLTISAKSDGEARLVLTDFQGNKIEPAAGADVAVNGEAAKDLKKLFNQVAQPGTYLLYVVGKDKNLPDFQGTPLVVSVRSDERRGAPAGPMVTKVEPLRYAIMRTKAGNMTMAFYYDVAPNTGTNFLDLASHEYYDNLSFHRIVPGFVIQGGDPRGDGTGGPGYQIDAEFNERKHKEGVLSMARSRDPNSAGSQFFVCLDYNQTKQLDGKYTAFGKVVDGFPAAQQIAKAELADPRAGRPKEPQAIDKVEVKPVTAQENPYVALQKDLAAGNAGPAPAPAPAPGQP